MNISRAITGVLSRHSRNSTKWFFSLGSSFTTQQLASLSSSTLKRTSNTITEPKPEASSPGLSSSPGTEAPAPPSLENYKKSSDLPRPKEIPFQPQILNQVHLVGYVGVPVQLQMSHNGSCVAFSVLTSKKIEGLLSFRISVIFHGDLAQIAACHLKENDLIYVTGQLSGDTPSVAQEVSCTNIQVIADKLSFVHDGNSQSTPSFKANASKVYSQKLWDDLVLNPLDWFDNREDKLNGLVFTFISHPHAFSFPTKSVIFTCLAVQIHPKYPDFKNRKTYQGLWVNSAPSWVSERLEGLVFASREKEKLPPQQSEYHGEAGISKQKEYTFASSIKNNETSWKNLIDNPKDWWDNRSTKPKKTYPDFKHKETGEALWLSSFNTPDWVLSKLPPVETTS
ncbi:protein OSB3, chloroplastic/mitochondrial-like isoform X1 [Zingiber officinale]|uniref:protein OSB3, chloroplastic/mitochondrial-like isoform X1 n=1 Tax=Zingiber officinale TaxID=94328 RepID=UPI001C4ADC10|nr:protein OSB3, chloroplastic/mitochondrial-like isoform X1 [Zingiber officinale]